MICPRLLNRKIWEQEASCLEKASCRGSRGTRPHSVPRIPRARPCFGNNTKDRTGPRGSCWASAALPGTGAMEKAERPGNPGTQGLSTAES